MYMPDRMGYSVIFVFKRYSFFSRTVCLPSPWSSWCSLSELMMWVRSNSTWQNKPEDVKSSLSLASPVGKQMSFHFSEKLFLLRIETFRFSEIMQFSAFGDSFAWVYFCLFCFSCWDLLVILKVVYQEEIIQCWQFILSQQWPSSEE